MDNDLNGDGTYGATTERDERDHNGVNELTARVLKGQGVSGADLTLDPISYDKNGNILDEQRQVGTSTSEVTWEYVHDAWNRLMEVKVSGAPDITKAKYGYNALNWRITKQVDTDLSGSVDWKSVMYYSANWQILEERIDSNADATDDSRRQYVWGARYIDDIIHSRIDANIDGDFTDGGDKRYYHLTDVQFSTVALTNDTSTRPKVLERVTYSAYGKARHHRYADLTDDGATNGTDLAILNGAWGGAPNPHIADLDRDGDVDGVDLANLNGDWASAQTDGVLSLSTIGNIIGWDGYVFNGEAEQYHVRYRVYEPVQGRWLRRDPLGYDDGSDLYQYVLSAPHQWNDPYGLFIQTSEVGGYTYYHVYKAGGWFSYEKFLGTVKVKSGNYLGKNEAYALAVDADRKGSFDGMTENFEIAAGAAEFTIRTLSPMTDAIATAAEFADDPSVMSGISLGLSALPGSVPGSCGSGAVPIGCQNHHFATNKHQLFTPLFAKLLKKYDLDLDDVWNKKYLPQKGRHPDAYHKWVQEQIERAAREAGDDKEKFLELFKKYVIDPVEANPLMLRKCFWEKLQQGLQ